MRVKAPGQRSDPVGPLTVNLVGAMHRPPALLNTTTSPDDTSNPTPGYHRAVKSRAKASRDRGSTKHPLPNTDAKDSKRKSSSSSSRLA